MQAKKKSTSPSTSPSTSKTQSARPATTPRTRSSRSPSPAPRPQERSRSASASRSRPRENAFSPLFMERARRREAEAEAGASPGESLADTPIALQARWTGPWEVEPVPAGHSILHAATRRAEPAAEGGGARLACQSRQEALLGTATFVALATPNRLTLNAEKKSGRRSSLGHPIHDGVRHIGHISPAVEGAEDRFLASFHTLRCLAANPDAAALFLEALDPETLAILGRAAMRKLS